MKTHVLIALALAAIAFAIGAKADQTPGAIAPRPKPSAALKGVVIDLITRAPVRSASVQLGPVEGPRPRVTNTDAEGRFQFTELPGGVYTVTATAPNYLRATLGARRIGGPGIPIEIADGETRSDIAIPMTRGGVISGRVVDDYGDPVPGLQVLAMRASYEQGTRGLDSAMGSRTDDQGAFRLFMLQPGTYYVLAQLSLSNTLGVNEAAGPVSTFFLSSLDAAGGQRVNVLGGRETSGVDIVLISARLARLRGRAITSAGAPFAGATLAVHSRLGAAMSMSPGTTVKPDGTFELSGVAPGQYVLTVQPPGMRAGDDVESGRVEIAVGGDDIDDISIVGARGSVLRGTVVTESGDPVPLPAQSIAIQPVPAPDERGGYLPNIGIKDDFSFELRNLFGRHRLDVSMSGTSHHWAMKTIRWRGEDVTHQPFDFRGQFFDGVEIVLSDQWATISGVVRDSFGAPAGDAPLVLFPVDEALRIPGSRYLRGVRSDREGRYGLSWLLPGDYYVASPRELEPEQWNDLAFLKSLVDGAARVTLTEDDERVLELRVRTP